MKIYISVDFEGLNGISKFSQTLPANPREYTLALEQLHKEVNAVIKGCFKAGAAKITVNDAHSSMTNININNLDTRANLITGKPKAISMMAGLNSAYNAAILIGCHAKAGTPGANMSHTFHEDFLKVKLNGKEVGEAYLNSLYAATLKVPIALISGDEALSEEIFEQIGDVPRVITKRALGICANISRPNNEVLAELEEAAYNSLNNPTNWILNRVDGPYKLEVEVSKVLMADLIELMPSITRTSGRKVEFTHPDYATVYKTLQAISVMIGSAGNYY